jgi:CheY-like chemotaxis protein
MTEVQPLTDEEIAEIEASWVAELGAMDGSTAIRQVNMLLQAGNVPSLIATIRQRTKQREQAMAAATQATADAELWAEALRQRDEAVALLADVEAYFHNGIDLNDLISYALRRATNPGA